MNLFVLFLPKNKKDRKFIDNFNTKNYVLDIGIGIKAGRCPLAGN